MSRRLAALDVGSNTVHLLVVDADVAALREVAHELTMPRLGRAVAARGVAGAAMTATVAGDVERLAGRARDLGAETLLLGATEAVRRAADRDALLAALSRAGGTRCVLIPADAEGRLAYRGAVSAVSGSGTVVVADIGGGSTECAVGDGPVPDAVRSLPIGSGVVTDRWLHTDPPTGAEWSAADEAADAALGDAPAASVVRGLLTGGTATTLPALLGRTVPTDLDRADVTRCRAVLAADRSVAVASRHGVPADRARVLAGGVVVVGAVMRRYALDRVTVTERGLRHGMVLAYLDRGDRWVEA